MAQAVLILSAFVQVRFPLTRPRMFLETIPHRHWQVPHLVLRKLLINHLAQVVFAKALRRFP
jgi:hypothetical protein